MLFAASETRKFVPFVTKNLSFYFPASLSGFNYSLPGKAMHQGSPKWEQHRQKKKKKSKHLLYKGASHVCQLKYAHRNIRTHTFPPVQAMRKLHPFITAGIDKRRQ